MDRVQILYGEVVIRRYRFDFTKRITPNKSLAGHLITYFDFPIFYSQLSYFKNLFKFYKI